MRKVFQIAIAAALTAAATLGIAAQAAVAADPQPDCVGQPQGIRYGWINTEPDTQLEDSEFYGGAVLCGSDTSTEKGFTSGIIRTPALNVADKGMAFRCANPRFPNACAGQTDLAEGRFVGKLQVDVMQCNVLGCGPLDNLNSYVYVHKFPSPLVPDNTDCARTYEGEPVVACLQGADSALGVGYSNMLVTREEDGIEGTGRYKLRILQPHSFLGSLVRLYYTKLGARGVYDSVAKEMVKDSTDLQQEIHVCKDAGAYQGTTCGTNDADWLQRNGPRQLYGCAPLPPDAGISQAVPWTITATRGWDPDHPANRCAIERWTQ